jgi:hypothetical protein
MPPEPVPSDIDIAFTFLSRDLGLAEELARLLRDHVSTFVFSEHQKDLAGTNGVAQFTNIYQKRARFVVVLYREGYGQTSWTGIEEAAVTSRPLELGWDSLMLISLDGKVPIWLPMSRLFAGIDAVGHQVAADAILGRFRERGQEGRPQSLVQYAVGISRQLASREEAELWQRSMESVDAAAEEVAALRHLLSEEVRAINEAAPDLRLSVGEQEHGVIAVRQGRRRVTFVWQNQYRNMIRDGRLFVRETELADESGSSETTREVYMRLSGPEPRLWVADDQPNRSFTTRELVREHITKLLPE